MIDTPKIPPEIQPIFKELASETGFTLQKGEIVRTSKNRRKETFDKRLGILLLDKDITQYTVDHLKKLFVSWCARKQEQKESGGFRVVPPPSEALFSMDLVIFEKLRVWPTEDALVFLYQSAPKERGKECVEIPCPLTLTADKVQLAFSRAILPDRKSVYEDLADRYKEVYETADPEKPLHTELTGVKVDLELMECTPAPFIDYLCMVLRKMLPLRKFSIPSPQILAHSKKVWCLNYLDLSDYDSEDPTPEFDDWLTIFAKESERATFRAWLWSVVDATNRGRQCLWIHDTIAETGKSRFCKALIRVFGPKFCKSFNPSYSSEGARFAAGALYGARLVLYPDCKQAKLIQTTLIHSMLGGDSIPVEKKGQTPFTACLDSKLLVMANIAPQINGMLNNESSRIIYLRTVTPPDRVLKKFCKVDKNGDIERDSDGRHIPLGYPLEERLAAELPVFLAKCREDYKELCPYSEKIDVPKDVRDRMKHQLYSEEQLDIEIFAEEFLAFGDIKDRDFRITAKELRELIQENMPDTKRGSQHQFLQKIYTFLESKGAESGRPRIPGTNERPVTWRGVREKSQPIQAIGSY